MSKRGDVVVGSVLLLRNVVPSVVRGVWVVKGALERLPVHVVSSVPTVAYRSQPLHPCSPSRCFAEQRGDVYTCLANQLPRTHHRLAPHGS